MPKLEKEAAPANVRRDHRTAVALTAYARGRAETFGTVGSTLTPPDRVPSVSYSELDAFRQCPLKWFLQWHVGLVSPVVRPALSLGSAWHRVMAAHHDELKVPPEDRPTKEQLLWNYRSVMAPWFDDPTAEKLDWMYEGYLSVYGTEPGVVTIATDLRLEWIFDIDGEPLRLKGFLDLLRRSLKTERAEVVDHKSASQRDVSKDGYDRELAIDDQFAIYGLLAKLNGYEVDFATWDVARTDRLKRDMTLSERFARARMHRSAEEFVQLEAEIKRTVRVMRLAGREPERYLYSAPDPQTCKWKCDVRDVHIEHRRTGRDPVLVAIEDYGFNLKPDRGVPEIDPNPDEDSGGF